VVCGGPQEGQALSKEVGRMIHLMDETQHIKTVKQFEDWNNLVYGHFQRAIQSSVKKMVRARQFLRHFTQELVCATLPWTQPLTQWSCVTSSIAVLLLLLDL
jgi:isochorismate synthase EntC